MLRTIQLLLPALIPSWRFFDTITASPRIEFVVLEGLEDSSEGWQEFRPRPAHLSVWQMVKRMFWNARWNESLFLASCAERLMQNPSEHSIQEIVTRIKAELARNGMAAPYFQFRLVFVSRQGESLHKDITYISQVFLS